MLNGLFSPVLRDRLALSCSSITVVRGARQTPHPPKPFRRPPPKQHAQPWSSVWFNYKPTVVQAADSRSKLTKEVIAAASRAERQPQPDTLYRRVVVETRGHDDEVLRSYERFLLDTARHLDVVVGRTWVPPKQKWFASLLSSVHIYHSAQTQYETRTHFRVVELRRLTGSTADTLLEYAQRNLPEGVGMKVTRYALERLPEHLEAAGSTSASTSVDTGGDATDAAHSSATPTPALT